MIGNIEIPSVTSLHDGLTIAGFTLTKTAGNEKMSTWRGTSALGKTVIVTLSQGPAKPTPDSYGRVRARMKVTIQVPEKVRRSAGVTDEGVQIYPSAFVDSIADVSLSVPASLETPAMDGYAFQVLNAFINAAPSIVSEASL